MSAKVPDPSPDLLLSVAKQAARRGGDVLLSRFRSDFKISKKGRIDLVTEMDIEAERVVVEEITRHFPEHGVIAEEGGIRLGDGRSRWIIDPLDGTTNFAHGYRFFCVSIALEVDEDLVLGVVLDPVTQETFSAVQGQGAFLNDNPIRVSSESNLEDSLLCTGFSYQEQEISRNLEFFNRLIFRARAIRRDGSAALDLCYLACGRFDGYWELSLNCWDVAAGVLIVQEAGGMVTSFNGSPCSIHDREILASNGRIHTSLTGLLTNGS